MLKVLVWLVLLTATTALGQVAAPAVTTAQLDAAVTTAQLDAAVEQVSATLAEDDPQRESLLKMYAESRAALFSYEENSKLLESFIQARANAPAEAESIRAALAELQAESQGESDKDEKTPGKAALPELEQTIQLDKAELDALKGRLADTRATIDGIPWRVTVVRERLTRLVGILAELESQLGPVNQAVEPYSEAEALLWLTQSEYASAAVEKAALDAELLSQPVRLTLLKARLDKTSYDIGALETRLSMLEQQAGALREGEAAEAIAEAELITAGAAGKHELVQQLAAENADLTVAFTERGAAIEDIRQQEATSKKQAEQLESDLKSIERKLRILGMTTTIGEILREQAVQLPSPRDAEKAISAVAHKIRNSSMQQIELEDERRQLRNADKYIEQHIGVLDPPLMDQIGDDLVDLAQNRRVLVRKAIELENTYASALGDLEFTLRRYDGAVEHYRDFISERLLWIPSRDPFSLVRGTGLPGQLAEVVAPARWIAVLRLLPDELLRQPLTLVSLLLLLLLIYFTPRLTNFLHATGRTVGYVRNDLFVNTLQAVGVSVVLAFTWPMLLLTIAWLFEMQEADSELAAALATALARTALYFWGLEFMRTLMLPGGLAASHFRWSRTRLHNVYRRVVRLEQTFLPATFLVVFAITLYPREVGGQLGALGVVAVLLSIAHYFRRMPHFVLGRMDIIFASAESERGAFWGRIIRFLLTWIPVLAIVGVLLGYTYTAMEFALLLIQTMVLFTAVLLLQELGLRWLRLTRRRMVVKVQEELSSAAGEPGEVNPEEEILENDPELLNDEGTKLLNAMVVIGGLIGIALIWAEVFPALGVLDTVDLWHQEGVVEGRPATIPVTLGDVFSALAITIFGWIAVRRIPSLLEILLRQRTRVSPGSAYAATRILKYILIAVLVVSVMGVLGGSWSKIQWAVAALSVGIGFGLQEIVANFISGLIILFEQPIRVGDTVTVGEVSGTVTKIRMRATTIRDWERRELLVPNKEFVTSQLLNWSLSDPVTRWSLRVGVAYGSDMARALAVVRQVAQEHPLILTSPEPIITFDDFGDNSLLITLRFFLEELDKRLLVASELRLAINEHFNAEGIVVSFPQRDVHLDTSTPLEIRMKESDA